MGSVRRFLRPALFDAAHSDEVLPWLETQSQQKVLDRFRQIPHFNGVKLFYNLDPRIFQYPRGSESVSITRELATRMGSRLAHYGIPPSALCLELTECMSDSYTSLMLERLGLLRNHFFKLALDDFGVGISGLQLLYQIEPDFLNIDRFFIRNIAVDARKCLFTCHIVSMAHELGISVIAEGVTNSREFSVCRDIGCDLTQGYFVQAPILDVTQLRMTYEILLDTGQRDGRNEVFDRITGWTG
jgi:EAL domain-containing protein (putative c-di-GMP-specific phosphodiesterase class I)